MSIHTVNIVTLASLSVFKEVTHAYILSLQELGFNKVHTTFIQFPEQQLPPSRDINIIIVGRLKLLKHEIIREQIEKYKNSLVILILLEQSSITKRIAPVSDCFHHILFGFSNLPHLSNLIYCPLGWSKAYETRMTPTETTKFFCFGSPTPERLRWERLYNIPLSYEVYGNYRDQLLVNAKLNIITRAQKEYFFPQLHYLLIASNKKLVVSNPHKDYSPYTPDHSFILLPKDKNKAFKVMNYWLSHDKERQSFEQRVYKMLKTHHTNTMYLDNAFSKIGIL